MTFGALHRVIALLAIGFASTICVLNPPRVRAAGAPPRDEASQRSGAHSATVQDVQRILAANQGRSDEQVARQLSLLTLTERMSDGTLQSLQQRVPGPRSHWALVALADDSVFLRPAAADVLSQAPPDLQEQRRMISLAVDYLQKTLPRLPDFYAARTTVHFHGSPKDAPWRKVGTSQVVVTFRDGKEVVDPRSWGTHPSQPENDGLITRGVFGPILFTVIRDAAYGETVWDRWEHGSTGARAVYRYRVPQDQSHYSVAFHSRLSDKGEMELGTGYHGEFAIDPATGAILHLTAQADLPTGSPIMGADIMVEYGPVEIGGKTYTCPLRSVSIALDAAGLMGQMGGLGLVVHAPPDAILLNDVAFGSYHLFRSSSRIMVGPPPAPNP
ncbi:MAG: hypothetical protein WCA37_13090 [Terracidiphilus sp.]